MAKTKTKKAKTQKARVSCCGEPRWEGTTRAFTDVLPLIIHVKHGGGTHTIAVEFSTDDGGWRAVDVTGL